MTLTTETIKQWRSDAENIARRSCEYETEYSAAEAILALTAELLANREAQPVGYFVRHRSAWDRPSKWRLWTECSVEDYAEFCKIIATGDADAGRFYDTRILYDAPPAPAVVKLPTEFYSNEGIMVRLEEVMAALAVVGVQYERKANAKTRCEFPSSEVPEEMTGGIAMNKYKVKKSNYAQWVKGWNACRAAMLAQPVSSGYKLPEGFKLVPVESTDAWAERYCELTNKHPDGGLTTYIGDGAVTITFREKSKREIDAMLAAAPEGGNG